MMVQMDRDDFEGFVKEHLAGHMMLEQMRVVIVKAWEAALISASKGQMDDEYMDAMIEVYGLDRDEVSG